jgi:hypothetical protein
MRKRRSDNMCNYATSHGTCGGQDNGLYCQNHQECRRGCGHTSVELDVVLYGTETAEEAGAALAALAPGKVAFTVVASQGPTGWPLIRFSGTEAQLHAVAQRYDTA